MQNRMDLDLVGFLTEGVLAHVADKEGRHATQAPAWQSLDTVNGGRPASSPGSIGRFHRFHKERKGASGVPRRGEQE
jgi:hypothetical protein